MYIISDYKNECYNYLGSNDILLLQYLEQSYIFNKIKYLLWLTYNI